ncbi:MAG: DMT family transporter, partial [Tumebacillaceae bacterium]
IYLSFIRISMTSLFLLIIGLVSHKLRRPTKREWSLLAGAGIFGTLMNQTFYFSGLHHSTAGNAALIIALAPIATTILARFFLKESLTAPKLIGAVIGLSGVVIIVLFGGGKFGIGIGDLYLLGAMMTLSISLIFIRKLTVSFSSFGTTIYSTILGCLLMAPAAGVEAFEGNTVIGHTLWLWLLLAFAAILAQGLAGFWWNDGVAVVGAGPASMFMNVPPFIALIVAHFILGDTISLNQIIGGILVLSGVGIANIKMKNKSLPNIDQSQQQATA